MDCPECDSEEIEKEDCLGEVEGSFKKRIMVTCTCLNCGCDFERVKKGKGAVRVISSGVCGKQEVMEV